MKYNALAKLIVGLSLTVFIPLFVNGQGNVAPAKNNEAVRIFSLAEKTVLRYLELSRENKMTGLEKLVSVETPKIPRRSGRNAESPSYDIVIKMTKQLLLVDFPKHVASSELIPRELRISHKSDKTARIRLRLFSELDEGLSLEAVFDLKDFGKGDWRITYIGAHNK